MESKEVKATELLDIGFSKYSKITIDDTSIYLNPNIQVKAFKHEINVQNKFILESIVLEGTLEDNLLFIKVYQLGDLLNIEESDLGTNISSILISRIGTDSSIIKAIKEVNES